MQFVFELFTGFSSTHIWQPKQTTGTIWCTRTQAVRVAI